MAGLTLQYGRASVVFVLSCLVLTVALANPLRSAKRERLIRYVFCIDTLIPVATVSGVSGASPTFCRRAFKETNSPLMEQLPPLPGKGQASGVLVFYCSSK